jgi:hypothetical protein
VAIEAVIGAILSTLLAALLAQAPARTADTPQAPPPTQGSQSSRQSAQWQQAREDRASCPFRQPPAQNKTHPAQTPASSGHEEDCCRVADEPVIVPAARPRLQPPRYAPPALAEPEQEPRPASAPANAEPEKESPPESDSPPTFLALDAWRGSLKLQGQRIRVRGEAWVRPARDGLYVEFLGLNRRLIFANVTEVRMGPLANKLKQEQRWSITIEGRVDNPGRGLLILRAAQLLQATEPEAD